MRRIRTPNAQVNEIANGKRRITTSTALQLAKAFGTSREFWLNGQLTSIFTRRSETKKRLEN